jgi:hypothetical protein
MLRKMFSLSFNSRLHSCHGNLTSSCHVKKNDFPFYELRLKIYRHFNSLQVPVLPVHMNARLSYLERVNQLPLFKFRKVPQLSSWTFFSKKGQRVLNNLRHFRYYESRITGSSCDLFHEVLYSTVCCRMATETNVLPYWPEGPQGP